ncbi:MAG: DUF4230 domain-containing protein [Firmicutes bacterium]|nr:DUF4230 domain-containing protein [Bacillota bacterium]
MKHIKKIAAAAALIACFAAGTVAADVLNLDFFPKQESTYDLKLMGDQVKEISEMSALEYRYKGDAVYDGGAMKLFGKDIPLTSKSMLVYYEGIVKLGSDLSTVHTELKKPDKLIITIPHSQVLSHEIDEDTWEVLDVDNGLFNRVTPEDNGEFVKEQKHKIEEEISRSDLTKQADQKVKKQLRRFLEMAYPKLEVTVEFVK